MKKILVIEDEPITREIICAYVEILGYSVLTLDSGLHVRATIEAEHPVACFLDLVMDTKDGMETLMEVRKLPKKPVIIAMSSNQTYLPIAKALGADATLLKPFSPEMMQAELQKFKISAE